MGVSESSLHSWVQQQAPQPLPQPAAAVPRLKAPALVEWQNSFAVIYSITEQEIVVGSPESGLSRLKPGEFQEIWGESGQVLLLQAPKTEQKEQFSFWWFVQYELFAQR